MKTNARWIVLIVLLVAGSVFAQTTGNLVGSVTSQEDGQPLPGVQVSISSDNLQGQRQDFTDVDGSFSFRGLPPGKYRAEAALDGFGTVVQEDVHIGIDKTITISLKLSAAIREVVTVTGAAPVVDVTGATAGTNFAEELFEALPTARNFQSLAFLTPGVVDGGLGTNPSVGGSSAAENRYIIDGIDTTDPAFGTVGSTVPMEFIQEVQVKTGAYDAEYSGALGGVINMVTKSGGNELHGDLFAYYTDDGLQETPKDVVGSGERRGFEKYDYGFDIGGKILADKLWYFVALNPSIENTEYTLLEGDVTTRELTRNYFAAKLTWKIGDESQLIASGFGDPTDDENVPDLGSLGEVGDNRKKGTKNYGLSWDSTFSSSLFLNVALARYDQTSRVTPFTDQPYYVDYSRGAKWARETCATDLPVSSSGYGFHVGCKGGTFEVEDGDRLRDNARASATWFIGHHQVKGGVDFRKVEYRDHSHYPGGSDQPLLDDFGDEIAPGFAGRIYYIYSPNSYELWDYDQNSSGETDELAFFLQDQWEVTSYLTLKVGLRFDSSESKGDATGETANLQALDFGFGDMIAPRIGVIWDPAKNGRSKVYAHWGYFYESVPLDINVRAFGHENYWIYGFEMPADGGLPTLENPGAPLGRFRFGSGTAVDPDLEAMYLEEFVGGVEYELFSNFALGLKYMQREIRDVIEDISVDGANTYYITNPGGLVTVNPVTGEQLETPVLFPEAVREYKGWELTFTRRLADNWQLGGSYVYSKNEGNYGGLYRQDNGQLDPNITSLFDLPELLEGAYGWLPNDRRHVAHAYGSYRLPFGLESGLAAQWQSGVPINKLGAHELYGFNERFVVDRGSAGRTPDTWSIDLHLEYPITLGSTELAMIADVFNITNEEEAMAVDETWTYNDGSVTDDPRTPAIDESTCGGQDEGCPGANIFWGTPTDYQDPRSIRFAVKLSW